MTHAEPGLPQMPGGLPGTPPPPVPPRNGRTWAIAAGVGAAAAVALVGIGAVIAGVLDGDDSPAAEPPPTTVEAQEYTGVRELRTAVEAAGHMCTSFEMVDDPTGALERAACTYSTTLGFYSEQAEAWASLDSLRFAADITGDRSVHLVGPNWTVNCGDDVVLCEDLQTQLGGEVDVYEP